MIGSRWSIAGRIKSLLDRTPRLKPALVVGLLALAGIPACAEQLAMLRNGFSIRHVRHELRDGVTRLYLTERLDSYVEIATEDVDGFEELEPPSDRVQEIPRVSPRTTTSVKQAISAAGSRSRIDPDLIESVIRAESGFHAQAVSPKGAQGLMQLMPETAARLGVENAMNPVANVEGGTRYLKELLARYDDDLVKALAAYNAGPKRVDQYHGVPPYKETRAYVTSVINDFNRKKLNQKSTPQERANTPLMHPPSKIHTEKLRPDSAELKRPSRPAD
jgi:hypothetical protein